MSGSGIVDSSATCGTVSYSSAVTVFSVFVLPLHDASKHIARQVVVININMRFIAIKASIQIRCKDMEKCGNGKIADFSVSNCDACSYFDVCVIR